MEIKYTLKDLENLYILVKRRSRVDYFYRGLHRRCSPQIRRAVSFTTLEEAQLACSEANKGKHRPFFKVKKASIFFGSEWRMNYSEYGSRDVEISNMLTPLKDTFTSKASVAEQLQKQKEDTLSRIQRDIESSIKSLEQSKNRIAMEEELIVNKKALYEKVHSFDYKTFVDSKRTESEKTAELLYGKT